MEKAKSDKVSFMDDDLPFMADGDVRAVVGHLDDPDIGGVLLDVEKKVGTEVVSHSLQLTVERARELAMLLNIHATTLEIERDTIELYPVEKN